MALEQIAQRDGRSLTPGEDQGQVQPGSELPDLAVGVPVHWFHYFTALKMSFLLQAGPAIVPNKNASLDLKPNLEVENTMTQ